MSDSIILEKLPKHIAIIMDGNGRWAKERGEDRLFGHMRGVESVRNVVESAAELGVQYLTLYAFSTENWLRPQQEVSGLMELLVSTIRKEVPMMRKNKIRLRVIGATDRLPVKVQEELFEAVEETRQHDRLQLILALSYSSRWEITRAARLLAEDVAKHLVKPEDIDESVFSKYLCTHDIPDPELMIRTSGEARLSNFLLFQLAYTELYFTPTHWPDFRKEHLNEAILHFQQRERRFGKTGEQVSSEKPS
ncbi:MAG: isoprenyl transferase [Ferruginibacter sp.]